MTIGEKIKQLRLQNDITQEKLADYLNISYQAISKWENNNALPDISLVVPLANFFGISTDELFDRTSEEQAADIAAYDEKEMELSNKGYIAERISLWREAAQKYPRNFHCLYNLADALWNTTCLTNTFKDTYKQNAEEAVSICERILKDCTDNRIRELALQILVFSYANTDLPFADEEKAEQYALMGGDFYCSRQQLLMHAYHAEDKKQRQKHYNNLTYMDCLHQNLVFARYQSIDDEIFAYQTALKLWQTLIYDDNFLFYHCRIADIYSFLASAYATKQQKAEVLENLKLAISHAEKADAQPWEEQNFTSLFVQKAASGAKGTSKNYTQTTLEVIRDRTKKACFDFIRGEAEFVALLND